jgi:hypothetical protein
MNRIAKRALDVILSGFGPSSRRRLGWDRSGDRD